MAGPVHLVDFSGLRPVLAALLYKPTAADGSLRLVRDVPYRSAAWNAIYLRARNAAESRNANLQRWQLKRLPVFGTPCGQATIFLADVWTNLTNMARLVQEATLAQRASTAAAA